ncbi:rCG58732 [Rattus norvegicus]|uniref:RCG58732 n=1 Tax=Rattus norvegicus TaxID=10116 RepID=A6JL30_RAT|nr:rCG58732 [Rattus norvegicus]
MDLRTLSGLRAKGWYSLSNDGLTEELWEAGGRASLRVPLLWRHSWAEQDLLQTTTRETESI